MSGDHKKHITISAEQIQTIRAALATVDSPADRSITANQNEEAQASAHLSDAQFLELCLNESSVQNEPQWRTHLAQCAECRAEWRRLQNLGAIWEDPAARNRLETRRDVGLKSAVSAATEGRPRIALSPLIRTQTAYAAQTQTDPEMIAFSVYADGAPLPGLKAVLCRRNHEFYALITPEDADAVARYGERSVALTIASENEQSPIVQRQIPVGVAVLLGTHLPLAADSYVEADLMSAETGP